MVAMKTACQFKNNAVLLSSVCALHLCGSLLQLIPAQIVFASLQIARRFFSATAPLAVVVFATFFLSHFPSGESGNMKFLSFSFTWSKSKRGVRSTHYNRDSLDFSGDLFYLFRALSFTPARKSLRGNCFPARLNPSLLPCEGWTSISPL